MGEWGKLVGGKERIFFNLNNKRKIREKVVILIDNLLQNGKMFLYWFDGNHFLTKGMAFKVSCGGCNTYYGSSGYKSSLK